MKKVIKVVIMSFSAFFLLSTYASAISFDFAAAIDTGKFEGTISTYYNLNGASASNYLQGELGVDKLVWQQSGLTLTATAEQGTQPDLNPAFVYLDAGKAGVGVCGELGGGQQCNPSSDDNVTVNEWLNISFDQQVSIDLSASLFRAGNHADYNPIPSGIWMSVGGSSYDLGASNASSIFTGSEFKFWTESDTTQFYVSNLEVAPVPEPATMLLFGTGLIGLVGASRRKMKKKITN